MMFCCGTQTKTASSLAIDKQIKQDKEKAPYEVKLLLLGTAAVPSQALAPSAHEVAGQPQPRSVVR